MQGSDLVLRFQGNLGMFRLNVPETTTYQEMKQKIADLMNVDAASLGLFINQSRISQSPQDPLYRIRGIEHGVLINYDAKPKTTSSTMDVEEMSEGKGPNAIKTSAASGSTQPISSGPITMGGAVPKGPAATIAPPGAPKATEPKEGSKEAQAVPDDKKKFSQDQAKHLSFDLFLKEKGALTRKHQNKSWQTDVNMPLEVSYKGKSKSLLGGKMTMDSLPPSINMKIQEWRHVDYVQFMNSAEISGFVNYWLNSFEERVGWLYGYYCEDPDYELGVRAVVEAIYEPPQVGTYNNVTIKDDPFQTQVDLVAEGLGLQKIGWIYTTRDHDTYMSPNHIMKAARLQNEQLVTHQLGLKLAKKDNPNEVLPEVFMISDMGTAMERDGVFTAEQSAKTKMTIRQSDNTILMPNVLMKGTPQAEVDHEFFLISINYGQPKSSKFSVLKNYDFPPMNRKTNPSRDELKRYIAKYGKKPATERYSNFQLILYLSRELDIDTALNLANTVAQEGPVDEIIDEMVKGMAS